MSSITYYEAASRVHGKSDAQKLIRVDSKTQKNNIIALSKVIYAIEQKLISSDQRIDLDGEGNVNSQVKHGVSWIPGAKSSDEGQAGGLSDRSFVVGSPSWKWYEAKKHLESILAAFPYLARDYSDDFYKTRYLISGYLTQTVNSVMKISIDDDRKSWTRVYDILENHKHIIVSARVHSSSTYKGIKCQYGSQSYKSFIDATAVATGKVVFSDKEYGKTMSKEVSLSKEPKRSIRNLIPHISKNKLEFIDNASQVVMIGSLLAILGSILSHNILPLIIGGPSLFTSLIAIHSCNDSRNQKDKVVAGEVVSTKIHKKPELSAQNSIPVGFAGSISRIMSSVNTRQDDMSKRIEQTCKRAEKLHQNEFLDAQTQASIDSLFANKLLPSVETYLRAASFAPTSQDLRWVKDTFASQLNDIDAEIDRLNKAVFNQRKEEMQMQSLYLASPRNSLDLNKS